MFISVFDLFKVGIGPSSSHTMGPMLAAHRFLQELASDQWPRSHSTQVTKLRVMLFGSLAYTGIGHATDRAIILGLCGYTPDSIDPEQSNIIIASVKNNKKVILPTGISYEFDPDHDLIFIKGKSMPAHSNGLQFEAYDENNCVILRRGYYSIGGGFILSEEEIAKKDTQQNLATASSKVPYPFANAQEMLAMAESSHLTIAEMKRQNELVYRSESELSTTLAKIAYIMSDCVNRGLTSEGILPGGLNVERRAKALHDKLTLETKNNNFHPTLANDWLAAFAIAVNEENACGGRVVTAPTNGAAGVIPAVLQFYQRFYTVSNANYIEDFFLTAAAIGGIIKANASISGAEVGCQGEVGSAASMAAAALTAVLGGTPQQIENAAEIALEHHLGMTCDPISGLVQIPCIERNALGAVKAVTASSLALLGNGNHYVSLDSCIETMRQTGRDMHESYKETSLGGLALNAIPC